MVNDCPRVFISYSHDSDDHSARIRGLEASLSRDGCDCRLDVHKDTDEDWPTWMTRQLLEADFVLCVTTETYHRRFRDEELPAPLGNKPEEVHVFDKESVWALNAALAARRPLLVRGEPGVGKTQLARAAAAKEVLHCPVISFVVDSSTESRDLLWTFDAVKRLAEAQISGALGENEEQVKARLDPERFFRPGPLVGVRLAKRTTASGIGR